MRGHEVLRTRNSGHRRGRRALPYADLRKAFGQRTMHGIFEGLPSRGAPAALAGPLPLVKGDSYFLSLRSLRLCVRFSAGAARRGNLSQRAQRARRRFFFGEEFSGTCGFSGFFHRTESAEGLCVPAGVQARKEAKPAKIFFERFFCGRGATAATPFPLRACGACGPAPPYQGGQSQRGLPSRASAGPLPPC